MTHHVPSFSFYCNYAFPLFSFPVISTEYRPSFGPGVPSQPFMDPAIMSSAPFVGLQPLDTSFTASPVPAYSPRLNYMRSPSQSFAQAHQSVHPPDGSMMGFMDPQLQMVDPPTSYPLGHIMDGQSPIGKNSFALYFSWGLLQHAFSVRNAAR